MNILNSLEPLVFTPELINEDTILAHAGSFDENNLFNLIEFLSNYYYNNESLVSDEIFDDIVYIYETKFNKKYNVVGAEPIGNKVQLPYYLGSLRKIKEEKELDTWMKSFPGPYIIEDKIDGLTLLFFSYTMNNIKINKLYTRGGGVKGTDVSHLLNYIKFPNIEANIAVRGEIVMEKEVFKQIGSGFKNARNMVSGIINSKQSFDPFVASKLSFFAYRIMNSNASISEDICNLKTFGFEVPNPVTSNFLSKDALTSYFENRKDESRYEIDGLVIYTNNYYEYPVDSDPKHVVAFKVPTENMITTVINVQWQSSKGKLLKPVVIYEPVTLSGAELSRVSGYNAKFIVQNNIGPGSKILISRSGDVIPKIISVITPSPQGPSYPDPNLYGNYQWNINNVEFVLINDNSQVIISKMKYFIETIGVKNLGEKRLAALYSVGIDNIDKLIEIVPEQLIGVEGIGATLANQYYNDINSTLVNIPLATIMDASGIFINVGTKRFNEILKFIPDLLSYSDRDPSEISFMIRGIKGFNMLSDEIGIKLKSFSNWLNLYPKIGSNSFRTNTNININYFDVGKVNGLTIVFSGFRDKDLENRIISEGGKVSTSVSKNTSMIVMKDIRDIKDKAKKGLSLNIPLIQKENFIQKYLS